MARYGMSKTVQVQLVFAILATIIADNVSLAVRQLPETGATLHQRVLLQTRDGSTIVYYIGASGDATLQFTDVQPILNSALEYIFPLSFAIDADSSGNIQNGVFNAFWVSSLTPQAAQSFKQANTNVKLMASLAGDSQFISDSNTRSVDWYDPPSTEDWINNAVSSITDLANQYSLDGIDIDYEHFPESSTFTACIGGLISQLKSNGVITLASIAPFGDTLSIYADLFQNYASSIDYVNYQFYAEDFTSPSDYVSRYSTVAGSFAANPNKLLASVDATAGTGLQGNDFIQAVQQLQDFPGIMIFDVDHDKESDFSTEKAVAAFLTGSSS